MAALSLVALAAPGVAGCALFGAGALRCDSDDNCPSGMHCAGGRCQQDVVDAGGSSTLDAAGSDGAVRDAGGADRSDNNTTIVVACDDPPCGMTPDSPTLRCATATGSAAARCPAPGEVTFGQDGNYLVHALDLQDDAEGLLLERVSGLRWELDAATGQTWELARARCQGLALAGLSWRLPTVHELVSLVDYGRARPAIDARFVAADEWYWSEDGYNGFYWGVDLDVGESSSQDQDGSGAVRCVSGDRREVDATTFDYVGGADGARLLDTRTGLEWQPQDMESQGWADALASCQALDHAGLDDWRLPSAKELETLVLRRVGQVMTYDVLVPETETASYWSATPCASGSGVWTVGFSDGRNACRQVGTLAQVRCVRGPEP